jgi:hypothetical protein
MVKKASQSVLYKKLWSDDLIAPTMISALSDSKGRCDAQTSWLWGSQLIFWMRATSAIRQGLTLTGVVPLLIRSCAKTLCTRTLSQNTHPARQSSTAKNTTIATQFAFANTG